MQRLGPDVGLSGLGGEGTNEARTEAGWEAWSGLWAGGAEVQAVPAEAEALEPIPPATLREALRRMSPRKSRGADGWGPRELGSLPLSYLAVLSRLISGWEKDGAWPVELAQVFVPLIPKPGAQAEGQFRPIGILPYVYRAWMVVRRALHGGRHVGAADLAAQVRREEEYTMWRGHFSITAYLDCSKCYERKSHETARGRVEAAGLPARLSRMIFAMYGGERRVRVHGVVSRAGRFAKGLVARRIFAKDVLKAFLGPHLAARRHGRLRDYVDDLAIRVVDQSPERGSWRLRQDLDALREMLRGDNMVLNPGIEQLWVPTALGRAAWEAVAGPARRASRTLAT